ncbi:Uncharacterised protein [Chryseobacterium gleum]|uniref:Uncharacterized protein n=1 Tax=Chryseobacterium gleum TaxID=250 RepID=A0A3S4QZU6_CHRGE|nr:Uncharacterised protein [Chryseobacterium gleum]
MKIEKALITIVTAAKESASVFSSNSVLYEFMADY